MGLVMVFMRVVINLLVVLSLIMSLVVALMSMVIDHNSKWIHKVPLLSEVKENLSFIEVTHFEDLLRILIFPTDHTIVISQITLVVIVLNVTLIVKIIFAHLAVFMGNILTRNNQIVKLLTPITQLAMQVLSEFNVMNFQTSGQNIKTGKNVTLSTITTNVI
jgi:hypothetical protein